MGSVYILALIGDLQLIGAADAIYIDGRGNITSGRCAKRAARLVTLSFSSRNRNAMVRSLRDGGRGRHWKLSSRKTLAMSAVSWAEILDSPDLPAWWAPALHHGPRPPGRRATPGQQLVHRTAAPKAKTPRHPRTGANRGAWNWILATSMMRFAFVQRWHARPSGGRTCFGPKRPPVRLCRHPSQGANRAAVELQAPVAMAL